MNFCWVKMWVFRLTPLFKELCHKRLLLFSDTHPDMDQGSLHQPVIEALVALPFLLMQR